MKRRLKLALLWVARSAGLFALARQVTRGKLRIICYHGFEAVDEARFRPKLFMKSETFGARVHAIQRMGFNVLSLDAAVDAMYRATLPDRALVITVDDGFAAFATAAAPALKRHGFPATVYVTTYYSSRQTPVFRLVVQYMFWKTRRESITIGPPLCAVERQVALRGGEAASAAMWDCIMHGERSADEVGRQEILRWLGDLLDVPYAPIVDLRMFGLLSLEEIERLAHDGIDVQLHTHRHIFPADNEERAKAEIVENRRVLSDAVERPLVHFCYPSGDWAANQFRWLDELGIRSSTTCIPGLNDAHVPRHALRRFLDGEDVHFLEFEAELSGFSELLRQLRGVPAAQPRLSHRVEG